MLDDAARRRRSRAGALLVLGAILVVHFLSREHAYLSRPIGETHFYPSSYPVSLSLVAGRASPMPCLGVSSPQARSRRPREDASSGYLLTIAGGAGVLTTRYLAVPGTAAFLTRHGLPPQPVQDFFFMFPSDGFPRAPVTLKGKGRIVSAVRLDASRWMRPASSTVYSAADRLPGAPRLPDGVAASEFFSADLGDDWGSRWTRSGGSNRRT